MSRFSAPLANRRVKRLLAAQVVSGLGDWSGRLALAVLVFERSNSAGWAAAVTVVSLLPWLGIGQLLATLSDRYGHSKVMVAADLAQACFFCLVLIPGQPIPVLLLWAFLAGMCVPPFMASRSAALVEVSEPHEYGAVLSLAAMLSQAEILAGYAVGGILIAAVGPELGLVANAATFIVSALLVRGLSSSAAGDDAKVGWVGVKAGVRVWRDDPVCGRALLLFVGIASFMILPEALVVPVAAELGIQSRWVGTLAALVAVGSMVGIVFAPSEGSHTVLLRRTAVRALVLAVVSAALFAVNDLPLVVAAAYVVSGMTDAAAVPTNQVVGQRLPVSGRAGAMAVAMGAHYGTQSVTVAIAGVAAERAGVFVPLVAGMACAGVVCVLVAIRPLDMVPSPFEDVRGERLDPV